MKQYRICLLDDDGRINLSFHLSFKDDLAVKEECATASLKDAVEVWDESRLVARFSGPNAAHNVAFQ